LTPGARAANVYSMESTVTTARPGLRQRAAGSPLPLLIGVTVAGFAAQRTAQVVLDGFYARSGYPVPYYQGQLSFSAARLQDWYTSMRRNGTLGVYWQTQFVDFAFIAATGVFFTALLLCVARAQPAGRLRRIGLGLVPAGLAAAGFDVLENLLSFVMLPYPASIDPLVALLYSGAAAAKFGAFLVVYGWVVAGLLLAAAARFRRRG
jgi:hypothetical protein